MCFVVEERFKRREGTFTSVFRVSYILNLMQYLIKITVGIIRGLLSLPNTHLFLALFTNENKGVFGLNECLGIESNSLGIEIIKELEFEFNS